jgi:ABC-type bacteriocin/lantibiotic exporter with double-glycine peptidase domain
MQEIVLAVIHSSVMDHIFGTIMGTVAGPMAIVFVPLAAGVVFIIITFLKRRKARTRTTAQ